MGRDIIKGLILRVHFSFDSANEITLATIGLYSNVVSKMLPTPGKMHYLFNLRDISKVETSPSPTILQTFEYHLANNRFSKACCEVTRTINSRGKPSSVYGCTRCSASSATD